MSTIFSPHQGYHQFGLKTVGTVVARVLIPLACSCHAWRIPSTGRENTPKASWCFREASIVNLVVADLFRVRAEMNSRALLTTSVFYHPGPLNTMADDVSRRFICLTYTSSPSFGRNTARRSQLVRGHCAARL